MPRTTKAKEKKKKNGFFLCVCEVKSVGRSILLVCSCLCWYCRCLDDSIISSAALLHFFCSAERVEAFASHRRDEGVNEKVALSTPCCFDRRVTCRSRRAEQFGRTCLAQKDFMSRSTERPTEQLNWQRCRRVSRRRPNVASPLDRPLPNEDDP